MTSKALRALRERPIAPSGNRLAAAFELDGRSQMDCARATGFSPQYITDVKAGRLCTITVENAHKFATFFDCHIEDIFPARSEAVA